MNSDDEPDFRNELRKRYLADLSKQQSLFAKLMDMVRTGELSVDEIAALRQRAHKLAGNGGTYGFPDISAAAAALENSLEKESAISRDSLVFHLDNLIDACAAAQTLPQTAFQPSPSGAAPSETPASEDEQEQRASSPLPLVLIVDDDPHARDVLVVLLQGEAEIVTASNAADALVLMRESRPDLLLLDDKMPGEISGLQLQEKIREIESLRAVPTIMITASDKSESVMRALTAGAVDYIVKPFDAGTVGEKLRTRLKRLAKTVLVVDDDPAIGELLTRKFAAAGYAAEVVHDGRKGLSRIIEMRPSLVVLDRMLPGLDGATVLQKMRARAELADIPVVMLSAHRQERDIVSGFDLGAADYVTKPFNPQELVARCVRLLESQDRSVA